MRGTAFITAAVAVAAACGPQAEPPRAPRVEAPEGAARLGAVSPVALAAAGDTVYYADLEGVWAQSILGGDARLIVAPAKLVERIVPHGDELVLGTADGVLATSIAGGAVRTIHGGAVDVFTVDVGDVWFVEGGALRVVPLAGGAARTVVADLGDVVAPIVTDADAVYAAVALDERVSVSRRVEVQAATLVRISRRDGARRVLAKRQFGVAALLRRDDRLYWTSFGAGLRSVAARDGAGDRIHTHLGGGGVALAADEHGIVVQSTTGLWIEVRPDGARVAPPAGDRQPEGSPGVVLAGGALVALVTDHGSGTSSLWRERRPWRSPITVAGWVTDGLRRMIATADGVLVLDALLDEAATGRVLRIDGRGRRTVLASAADLGSFAVDGATLAYHAGDAIWRKEGAAAPVRAVTVGDAPVLGLVVADGTLYWSDTQVIHTAPASGGAPATLFDPPHRSAGTGRPDAQLVVDGASVYFNSLGWSSQGIQRVTGPTTSETIFEPSGDGVYPGDTLVRVGDALYTSTTAGEIVRAPLAGGGARAIVTGLETAVDLAGGGDRLVAQYFNPDDNGPALVAVEPRAGKPTRLVAFPGESRVWLAVAPAGDAVFVGLDDADLIVRVPLPPRRR